MADDAPNEPQVDVCRNRIHERIFGKFLQRTTNVRDSSLFKYQDCVNEAENEIIKARTCVSNYVN